MKTMMVWRGPNVAASAAQDVLRYLRQEWPDTQWFIKTSTDDDELGQAPTVILLTENDHPPALDPAGGAIIWWNPQGEDEHDGIALGCRAVLRAQIERLRVPRVGKAPSRTYAFTHRMSRADLLRIPRPQAQPLSYIPWITEGNCLKDYGCTECVKVCPANALCFSSGNPEIQANHCQECGACVAACPTGTLQSATLSDRQWQILSREMESSAIPLSFSIQCREDQYRPSSGVHITVGCLGELGWPALWALARLEEQVTMTCPNRACPKRDAAALMEARWKRIQRLMAQESSQATKLPPPAEDFADSLRWSWLVGTIRTATRSLPRESLSLPEDPPLGYQVAMTSQSDHSCTLCEGCVNRCPSGALSVEKDLGGTRRLQVASYRCLGCRSCEAACSEHVLRVEADHTMTAITSTQKTTLFEDTVLRCLGCGAPLESAVFLQHIESTLKMQGFLPDALRHLQLCPTCKDRQLFFPAR